MKVLHRDIVEELKEALATAKPDRPGSASADINVFALPVTLTNGTIERAIKEIERLRRLSGAVSEGESFDEIRKLAKAGEPLIDLQKR